MVIAYVGKSYCIYIGEEGQYKAFNRITKKPIDGSKIDQEFIKKQFESIGV